MGILDTARTIRGEEMSVYVNAGQASASLLKHMIVGSETHFDPRIAERLIMGMCKRVYVPVIRVFRDDLDRNIVLDGRAIVRAIQSFWENEWEMSGVHMSAFKGFHLQLPRMAIRKIEEAPIYLITMTGDFREVTDMCAQYPLEVRE